MVRHVILVGAAMLTLGQVDVAGQPKKAVKGGEQVRTRLDVRISPAIDLHFYIRELVADDVDPASVGGLASAVEAGRELNDALGEHMLRWGPLEGALVACDTAADVVAAFGRLPETYGPRLRTPGKTIQLRESAVTYANALQSVEPHFLEAVWPEHRQCVVLLQRRLHDGLRPKEAKAFEYMIKHLGMKDPAKTIPVYLVAETPFPGAYTHRGWDGDAVCFVGSSNVKGSQLYETVLHEATRALDIATVSHNVFTTLREKLSIAGVSRRDQGFRDVPHTLMLVHTAETVRRQVDSDHKHNGRGLGYYKKVPKATGAVLQPWIDYLDGMITQDEALDRIVQDFLEEQRQP